MKVETLLNAIAQVIHDKKGMNILALDVKGLSSITDYLVIAEGLADRHVIAIAQAIIDELAKNDISPIHKEGLSEGDWVVLDYGEVMIHLFKPGFREKYSLERLWQNSQLIDLTIDFLVSPKTERSY